MSLSLKKIFFYFLLFYALFGFAIVPLVLKPKIIEIVAQETNAKIDIGSISFNPFIFKIKISDVVLYDLEDKQLLKFNKLILDIELYSFARKALHVKELTLLSPKVSLVHEADKTFNILNILKTQEEKEDENSSIELPRIIVDSVKIKEGEVHFKDLTLKKPFDFSFKAIGFSLKHVDTDESDGSRAKLRLYTTLGDGGFFDFTSNLESLNSLKANGNLTFQANKLYTEWKYVQDILNLEVADGQISFYGDYEFVLDDINATKIENIVLSIEKLRIKPKTKNKDILNIKNFSIENATVMPFTKSIEINKITLDGLKATVERNKKEEIDWIKYIKINQDKNTPKVKSTKKLVKPVKSEPWNVLVKDITLKKIALGFEDKAITPKVITKVNELNFNAKNMTLLGKKPFEYSMDMKLNAKTKCNSKGSVKHKTLHVKSSLECQDFDLTHYNPYLESEAKKALKLFNVELYSAIANLKANINFQDKNNTLGVLVSDASLAFNSVSVGKKGNKEEIIGFQNFLISGINIDTKTKNINLEKLILNNVNANIQKYKNGSLNLDGLVEAKENKETKTLKEPEPEYAVHLKHFALNSSNVSFSDYSLQKKATNQVSGIYANAYDINLEKNSWLNYDLVMRINSQGELTTKGKFRHTPLKQVGTFDIKNISLVELTPYLQESAHVSVEDGKVSLKGSTMYEKSSLAPDLRVHGSVGIKSFFMNETLNNTQLISLGEADVKSYIFELNPNRLHIDEVDINAFYVDTKIDKNKTINFSKLLKNKKEETPKDEKETPFAFRILKVNVAYGSARFADYSIPIKFATHIHNVNGAIYSISNTLGDTSYVDIAGEVDKYASTRLKGSVDSSNPKAYTDLDFNFQNLDLNSLSGYSASFAGHEIKSGKLNLDLGYDILDSQLKGSNSVIIKKIKLGRVVKDENTTVLPLGFVIGLLEDSDGVMDIDMPVEGNLDEPDFKYGKLVFQTLTNLVSKAVLSPFKFLATVMGMNGDKLEYIAYEAGRSDILPPQREKLDIIAKMMRKKPKILLEVSGAYELVKDKEALQLHKLINLVVEESGIKDKKEHKSVMNIDMLERIYKQMRNNDVLHDTRERLNKKHTEKASYERAYSNELLILCRDIQEISESELVALADERRDKVIAYLVEEKMLKAKRILKKTSKITQKEKAEFVKMKMGIEIK